jgi:predicted nucleic acid-binding protein
VKERILIDSSALVAIINKRDDFHDWAVQTIAKLAYPFLTCEPVITETCFLLKNVNNGEDAVMGLLSGSKIQIPFHISQEASVLRELMRRYQSVPMSLADACLVRMAGLYSERSRRLYKQRSLSIIQLMASTFWLFRVLQQSDRPLVTLGSEVVRSPDQNSWYTSALALSLLLIHYFKLATPVGCENVRVTRLLSAYR